MKLLLLSGATQLAIAVEFIVHKVHPLGTLDRVVIVVLVAAGLFTTLEVFLDRHEKTEYLLNELAEYAERAEQDRYR